MSEPLVIVGNGMAAARLVDELSKVALGRYAIAVIGDEPQLAYNRVLLSSVLAGEAVSQDIELKPASWWRDRGVTLRYGCAAQAIDTASRNVLLADGGRLRFSKLILATGSTPLRLPVPGADLPGVVTFRDSRDVAQLAHLGIERRRVAVIGGGLLGLEAAYGLTRSGASVVLVHLMDRLMERQLDAPAARLLKQVVEARGIEVLLGARTARINGKAKVQSIDFADGRTLDVEAVVVAAGIQPNTALAEQAGIATKRGVLIDDHLQTSERDIFALGECAEHRGICYGLVEPAYEQAKVLAGHLCGKAGTYQGSVMATNLKVSGIHVFSAGDFLGQDAESLVLSDPGLATYKKLVIANDRLVGVVLIGDTADALWYLELIRASVPVEPLRDDLMFGRRTLHEAA